VAVVPNSTDWNYNLGDKAVFDVTVTQNSIPVENVEVRYELSYDMMKPFKVEKTTLKNGKIRIDAGSLKTAGFLRCQVFATYGKQEYEGRATAGFAPEKIQPTTQMPVDFEDFWNKAKEENAKVPLNPTLRLLPERCSSKSNVYELNIQINNKGARLFGILCIPKKKGKYPALLRVPGAGIRPYAGHIAGADNGYITIEIGIHGIPVTMEQNVYDLLESGALYNYPAKGLDDVNEAYYKRVYLGCIKVVDYIFGMTEFDGKNLLVQGGSQGGALSIVTAALDKRVSAIIAFFPALCDLGGYTTGRAGGWPHLFKDTNENQTLRELKVKNSAYYDVVNFARILSQPGFYSFGYNDMVCPPTSMFSAYNVITASKKLMPVPETAHYAYPEQWDEAWCWWDEFKTTINK
jgi:cephalosporin-C deacetylase-like acetyl esterase